MKLPVSLVPWAGFLQIFPEEISFTLGGYVRKISPFISPLSAIDEISGGEPNGYDGVTRRGIYERLLLSELALADEFPDEFIRRAVMGEHLFLQLAKVEPSSKRVSIALFDAGALQLGTPRIAHMAVFIILARRAEAAGAAFLWGVLQDSKHLIIPDDTEASIKILLESRTPEEVSKENLAAWREKLNEIDKPLDVWLIGSESLSQFEEARGFSHLYIEELLDLEKREIVLKVKSGSGTEKKTNLELPPPDICTRLLRNPFELPKPVEFKTETLNGRVTNFFFDGLGSKLFAKLDSKEILCFDVQNTRKKTPNFLPTLFPKSYSPSFSEQYVAVGRLRKALALALKVDNQTLRLEYRRYGFGLKQGLYTSQNMEFAFPKTEEGLLQIYNAHPKKIDYDEAAIIDANGNLFLLNQQGISEKDDPQTGRALVVAQDVLAVTQTDKEFLYVGRVNGKDYHQLVSVSDRIELKSVIDRIKRAIFGRGELGKTVLAMQNDTGHWAILDEEKHLISPMTNPRGEVVGVFHDSKLGFGLGLFELMDDRKTLEFNCFGRPRKQLIPLKEEIVKIEFSPRGPFLAYQTVGGELILYSLSHRTAIARYSK